MLAAADRRLGLSDALAALIPDDRDPALITHSVADILRERIFAIACDATEKECASCHVIKPMDAFHRDRTNTDGRWVYCENCQQRLQAASRVHDLTAAFSNFYQVARTRARSKSLPFTISKQDLADIWTGDCAVCRIHTGQRASAGAGRHSAILSRDSAFGAPDAVDTRTGGVDLAAPRGRPEHRCPARSRRPTRIAAGIRSTGQNHCAELLARHDVTSE